MNNFAPNLTKPCDSLAGLTQAKYRETRQIHWNQVARKLETWKGWGGYYHQRLNEIYQSLVAPGQSVLELGCARGDLLAAVKPSLGVGVDFSEGMINAARHRHPQLCFIHADAHELNLNKHFDVIILSDLVNDVWDVETVFQQVARLTTSRTGHH
jgi:ubiquinone/menaquinone biosynthesis C-methylase UbiE